MSQEAPQIESDDVVDMTYDTPEVIEKYKLREYYYNVTNIAEASRKGISILNDKDKNKFLKIELKSEDFIGTHVNGAIFEILYKVDKTKTETEDAKFTLARVSVPDKFDREFVLRDNPKGILETVIEVVCGRAELMGFERYIIDCLDKENRSDEADLYFHVANHVGSQNQIERFFETRPDALSAYEEMLAKREERKKAREQKEDVEEELIDVKPKKWWAKSSPSPDQEPKVENQEVS